MDEVTGESTSVTLDDAQKAEIHALLLAGLRAQAARHHDSRPDDSEDPPDDLCNRTLVGED